jgi:hypothetical protein
MELLYLKLSNIFTIDFIDCDSIINTETKDFANFFRSKKINYKTSLDTNNNNLRIVIKKKPKKYKLFDLNKTKLLILVSDKYYEIFDTINNYYIKNKLLNNHFLLNTIIHYFSMNITLELNSGNFILPIGYKNTLDIRLGFLPFYFLTKTKDKYINIKFIKKKFKIKPIKILYGKNNYLPIRYLDVYINSTLTLSLKYFEDNWFYQKYIKNLNNLFNLKKNSKELYLILHRVINCALQKSNNNNYYNNYKIFIENYPIYSNMIIDLFNFKTYCKTINDYNKNLIQNNLTLDIPDESLDFYTSKISYNNWFDDFTTGDCFGFLIHGNFKRNCIEGLEPDIYVRNLNQCVISTDDYIESHYFYFKKYKYFDNGRKKVPLISFDGIGKGNLFIPLYICNLHFKLVISNINLITSMNIYQTPIKFTKANILVYISLLSELIYYTFCNNKFNTERWYNILFNYILFVKELINIYYTKTELTNLFNKYLNKIKFNINFTIGIYIILKLNKINIDITLTSLILKILEEELRLKCSKYSVDLKNTLNDVLDISYNKYNLFLDNFNTRHILNKNLIKLFEKSLNKHNDLTFMKKLWSLYQFDIHLIDKFDDISNTIETNYGILSRCQLKDIKSCIDTYHFTEENDTINGIVNPLFSKHMIYNKVTIIKIQNVLNKIEYNLCSIENIQAMILQGILQRNYNKRKIALKSKNNKLYYNPIFEPKKCILHCLRIFLKVWAVNSKSMISDLYLSKQFKNLINIKHIVGLFFILRSRNNLLPFIIEYIKEGNIKNLSLKLSILNNPNFIDKKYLWLLPDKKYSLDFVEIT